MSAEMTEEGTHRVSDLAFSGEGSSSADTLRTALEDLSIAGIWLATKLEEPKDVN